MKHPVYCFQNLNFLNEGKVTSIYFSMKFNLNAQTDIVKVILTNYVIIKNTMENKERVRFNKSQ